MQIIHSRIKQKTFLYQRIEEAKNFNNRILELSLILCRSAGVFILAHYDDSQFQQIHRSFVEKGSFSWKICQLLLRYFCINKLFTLCYTVLLLISSIGD